MFRSLGVQVFRSSGVTSEPSEQQLCCHEPLNSVFDASEPSELTEPQLRCIT